MLLYCNVMLDKLNRVISKNSFIKATHPWKAKRQEKAAAYSCRRRGRLAAV